MSDKIDVQRRNFFGSAAMTLATAQFALAGASQAGLMKLAAAPGADLVRAKSAGLPAIQPGANTGFPPSSFKQIDAGLLNVGYVEVGPSNGPVVLLLHGWPYDIYSFVDVAPLLAGSGYRVIIPYFRGYGSTRFLSQTSVRNGQPSAIAADMIALLDALRIEKAVVAGFDWGARTANIMAALWPERCKAMVSVSGYLIGSQQAGKLPLPPKAELQWWYQFYFATERAARL